MKKNFYKFCIDGINKIEQPFNLALLDINLKYKRTVIGSFWSVITYLITISIISIIWSKVFDASFNEFFPKLFFGFTIFFFINNFISSSSRILYEQYSGIIYGMGVNLNIVLLRHFLLLIFEFFHLLPIYLIIIFLFQININLNMLLFFPGLILVLLNCFLFLFLITLMCARFRDLSLLISSIMSAGILLTPILWEKERLGQFKNYVYLNPLTSMIESIRDPLLGLSVNYIVYFILGILFVIQFFICHFFFKYKSKYFNNWI